MLIVQQQNLLHPNSNSTVHLSLIIPTYQESANIEKLILELSCLLDSILPDAYELIVVDDDSPDQTWRIAQQLVPAFPQLKVIRRTQERGLATAVIRGWQIAQGDVLGVIDGDLQHPPETLFKLWSEVTTGADLAIASRYVEGGGVSEWSFVRRFLSWGAQTLGRLILPEVISRLCDPMSGFFLVRRRCLLNCSLSPLGYKILIEVVARGNVGCIREVGYVFRERKNGASKVTRKQYMDYINHLLRLRFTLLPLGRFLRFGLVGLSGVCVDLAVFYLLREVGELALTHSAIFSTEVAIINNFLWNDFWTFGDLSKQQKGLKKRLKRFFKFNLICLAGLILNVLIVSFLFKAFGVNEYLSKLSAIAAVTLWNFWLNFKLNWQTNQN